MALLPELNRGPSMNRYGAIHGSGGPLVSLHGGGSTIRTTFGRILHGLAKTHQVIAVELQAELDQSRHQKGQSISGERAVCSAAFLVALSAILASNGRQSSGCS